jgi:hypothetical protein
VSWAAYGPTGSNVANGFFTGSGGGGSPGAPKFLGFVSDDPSTHISRILIIESDGNNVNPDCNVGYDSVRFFTAVPEPRAIALLALAALAGGRARRR